MRLFASLGMLLCAVAATTGCATGEPEDGKWLVGGFASQGDKADGEGGVAEWQVYESSETVVAEGANSTGEVTLRVAIRLVDEHGAPMDHLEASVSRPGTDLQGNLVALDDDRPDENTVPPELVPALELLGGDAQAESEGKADGGSCRVALFAILASVPTLVVGCGTCSTTAVGCWACGIGAVNAFGALLVSWHSCR